MTPAEVEMLPDPEKLMDIRERLLSMYPLQMNIWASSSDPDRDDRMEEIKRVTQAQADDLWSWAIFSTLLKERYGNAV